MTQKTRGPGSFMRGKKKSYTVDLVVGQLDH